MHRVPARLQTWESHNRAVLSVYLKHAFWLELLGERQHIVGVTVGGVNPAYGSSWESVCRHDDEDFQGGNDGFVLTVADDPQKDPGRRGESRLTRITGLRGKLQKSKAIK